MLNNITFEVLFIYFFIYSVLGWICEMIYCGAFSKRFTNRGFLFGPYCPIYGFGGVMIVLFLEPLSSNPFLIFLVGLLLTSTLEYITSFLMEKAFNAKWWDYSGYKFNINGRVCLLNSTLFGMGSLVITYLINPYVQKFVELIPKNVLNPLSILLMFVMSIDLINTLNSVFNLKDRLKTIKDIGDLIEKHADDIKVKDQLEQLKQNIINKKNMLNNRFISSFPRFHFIKNKQTFEEFKALIEKRQNELKNIRKKKIDKKV